MDINKPVEIGWRKELLQDSDNQETSTRRRSRSPIKKKKHYHRLSASNSTSSDSSRSSSSSSSDDNDRKKKKEAKSKRKEEKKLRKDKKKLEKAQHKEMKKAKKEKRKEEKKLKKLAKKSKDSVEVVDEADCAIPIDLMINKVRAPETREEYEARQSKIKRVTDPETGRTRLIKGDGEILEEIVSRDRHKDINKRATKGDGDYYQSKTIGWNSSD